MRYFFTVLIIVLLAGGIWYGFNLGKNNRTNGGVSKPSSPSAKVLDLSKTGLTKVTSDIYSKTNTTDLILSNNNLKTLPSEMGRMTNVVVLKIDHNLLEGSLIGEIRQLSKLQLLDVSYNNMTGMPAEIGQLGQLETLDYSYNNITGLPNELANLKNNLKEFNLTGNPLSQSTISKLKTELPNTDIIF